MKLGILLYDNITALDAVGPYDVLSRIPNTQVLFIGTAKREYKDQYGLKMIADYSIDEITELDVLLIPGGFGIDLLLDNQPLINWIIQVDKTTRWSVSVCSGSLLLAQCGLLNNRKCTTHWRRKGQLENYNVEIVNERYVEDGKYITSAGVSAGIDMALYLVSKIAGEKASRMIQTGIEYDPQPPFQYISPEKFSV
jgi:transcriptional regulator GlxA family with amidase domain